MGIAKTKIFSVNFSNDISNLVVNVALPLSILLSTQKYISKQNFWLLVQDTILIMIAIIICFLFSMSFSYFSGSQKSGAVYLSMVLLMPIHFLWACL